MIETPSRLVTGWFKSSRSNTGDQCVEVAFGDSVVFIRDSKYLRDPANDPARQPVAVVGKSSWAAFLVYATDGRASRPAGAPQIEMLDGGSVVLRTDSAVLTYTPGEWAAFTAGIRDGEFDLQQLTAA
jgi:hypothetical protein